MQMELAWQRGTFAAIALAVSSWATSAIAQCDTTYSAGLEDGGGDFHAYSVCMKAPGQYTNTYKLKNKVCAPTSRDLGFRWQELLWASGSAGVPSGSCMNLSLEGNLGYRILSNSTVNTTLGDGRLNTFVPKTPTSLDDQGFVAVEAELARAEVAGGPVTPYLLRFSIQTSHDRVSYEAQLVGNDVELVILLPRAIDEVEDLVEQGILSQEQLDIAKDRIAPASAYLDPLISDAVAKVHWRNYSEALMFRKRLALPVPASDGVASQTLRGQPDRVEDIDILFDFLACVSMKGLLDQCVGIPNSGGD